MQLRNRPSVSYNPSARRSAPVSAAVRVSPRRIPAASSFSPLSARRINPLVPLSVGKRIAPRPAVSKRAVEAVLERESPVPAPAPVCDTVRLRIRSLLGPEIMETFNLSDTLATVEKKARAAFNTDPDYSMLLVVNKRPVGENLLLSQLSAHKLEDDTTVYAIPRQRASIVDGTSPHVVHSDDSVLLKVYFPDFEPKYLRVHPDHDTPMSVASLFVARTPLAPERAWAGLTVVVPSDTAPQGADSASTIRTLYASGANLSYTSTFKMFFIRTNRL